MAEYRTMGLEPSTTSEDILKKRSTTGASTTTTTAASTPSTTTAAATPATTTAAATPAPTDPGTPSSAGAIQGLDPYGGPTGLGETYRSQLDTGYQHQDDDVANIAGQYMSQDSLLMQKAAAAGRQAGNARGMLNSSISAGAGMSAALEHVVPMASQTAQQRFQQNFEDQQVNDQSALSSQEYGQTSRLSRQEAEQQSGLSRQEYGQTSALSKQEFEQTGKLAYEDFTYDRALMELDGAQKLELQKQGFNYDLQLQQDKQRFDAEIEKNRLNLTAAQQADSAVAAVWDDYYYGYNNIMANKDLNAKQRQEQLDALWETAQDRIYANSVVYGQEYSYDQPDQDIYNNPGPMYDGDEDKTPAKDTTGGADGGTTDATQSRQAAISGTWSGQTWDNHTDPKRGDTRVTQDGTRQIYIDGKWQKWSAYKSSLDTSKDSGGDASNVFTSGR